MKGGCRAVQQAAPFHVVREDIGQIFLVQMDAMAGLTPTQSDAQPVSCRIIPWQVYLIFSKNTFISNAAAVLIQYMQEPAVYALPVS